MRWQSSSGQVLGTSHEVTGMDIFVVRKGKVVMRSLYVDRAKY